MPKEVFQLNAEEMVAVSREVFAADTANKISLFTALLELVQTRPLDEIDRVAQILGKWNPAAGDGVLACC